MVLALGAMELDPPWSPTDLGRMAVLRVGSTDVVLSERKAWGLDTVVFRHVGLDPARYQVVQVEVGRRVPRSLRADSPPGSSRSRRPGRATAT